MSYRLFLDDYRKAPQTTHVWITAKSLAEFKRIIMERGLPEFVGFDHDLTQKHYGKDYSDGQTGLDAAAWLHVLCVEQKKSFPKFGIHTMNEERGKMMLQFLNQNWPEQHDQKMYLK